MAAILLGWVTMTLHCPPRPASVACSRMYWGTCKKERPNKVEMLLAMIFDGVAETGMAVLDAKQWGTRLCQCWAALMDDSCKQGGCQVQSCSTGALSTAARQRGLLQNVLGDLPKATAKESTSSFSMIFNRLEQAACLKESQAMSGGAMHG